MYCTPSGSLDREIQSSHAFRIQATEEVSGRSSIAQMTITVLDENDNTPTFERSYFNLTVEEDEEVRCEWQGEHMWRERREVERGRGEERRGEGEREGERERGRGGVREIWFAGVVDGGWGVPLARTQQQNASDPLDPL